MPSSAAHTLAVLATSLSTSTVVLRFAIGVWYHRCMETTTDTESNYYLHSSTEYAEGMPEPLFSLTVRDIVNGLSLLMPDDQLAILSLFAKRNLK